MQKVVLISLLTVVMAGNCLATDVLRRSGESELRHRKAAHSVPVSSWLSAEEKTPFLDSQKPIETPSPEVDEEKLNEILFSPLGDIWTAFKTSHFDGYFDALGQLRRHNDPRACYLLGVVHEKGLGRIKRSLRQTFEWYTYAVAYSEGNPLLNSIALKAFHRVKDELAQSKLAR
tara:strand:- start:3098 stop:3619 length:522 start_codon:yes stop_codon:yes gene_type:complete